MCKSVTDRNIYSIHSVSHFYNKVILLYRGDTRAAQSCLCDVLVLTVQSCDVLVLTVQSCDVPVLTVQSCDPLTLGLEVSRSWEASYSTCTGSWRLGRHPSAARWWMRHRLHCQHCVCSRYLPLCKYVYHMETQREYNNTAGGLPDDFVSPFLSYHKLKSLLESDQASIPNTVNTLSVLCHMSFWCVSDAVILKSHTFHKIKLLA